MIDLAYRHPLDCSDFGHISPTDDSIALHMSEALEDFKPAGTLWDLSRKLFHIQLATIDAGAYWDMQKGGPGVLAALKKIMLGPANVFFIVMFFSFH